uniref:Uncharacterized protein n=1 Tax=Tanacetum cinerariifolium TaxID=118510 RepID=A0A6L2JUP1_TANCI|nr:hypothetical protein [Tanacetum cinerariifolium]
MASIRAIILSVSELLLPSSAKATVFLRDDLENTTSCGIENFLGYLAETMIEDYDNIALGQIVTMAVFEHLLHTKLSIAMFLLLCFGPTIKMVSLDKGQVVTFNGKFVCGFWNSKCETGSQSDNMVGNPHRICTSYGKSIIDTSHIASNLIGDLTRKIQSKTSSRGGPHKSGEPLIYLGLLHKKFYNSLGSAPNRCSVVWARLGVVYRSLEE